jgi:hypothetical protein
LGAETVDEARRDAYDEGYAAGLAEGMAEGCRVGYERGFERGHRRGLAEGRPDEQAPPSSEAAAAPPPERQEASPGDLGQWGQDRLIVAVPWGQDPLRTFKDAFDRHGAQRVQPADWLVLAADGASVKVTSPLDDANRSVLTEFIAQHSLVDEPSMWAIKPA